MPLYRVFIKVIWHDRELLNSYYQVAAHNPREARKISRQRAKEEVSPHPKAKLYIRTSFKRFLK